MIPKNKITLKKLNHYYNISDQAHSILKTSIVKGQESQAKEVLEIIYCYLKDAKHFQSQGNLVNAFASINYAHGWIDCACRLKIFTVNNSKLFAVDEKID